MAEEGVKIRVQVDAATNNDDLDRMLEKVKKLRAEANRFDDRGMPKIARLRRKEADRLERQVDAEGNRRLRIEDDEARRAKYAPIEATKEKLSKGLVEEAETRAAGNVKAADAMRAENEIMARALQLQRTRNVSQKQAMLIAREELALKKAGMNVGVGGLGGILGIAGVSALLGQASATTIGQFEFGESLQNRYTATAARNERQMRIMSGVRGSSNQLMSESWAAEDRAAEIRRQMPQIKTDQKYDMMRQGLTWGGIGAAAGTAILPGVGTAIGGIIGGGIGVGSAYFGGQNRQKQATQDAEQEDKLAEEAKERARKRFRDVEGGLEIDALRGRSKRSLEGQKEAFTADMVAKGIAKYNQARHAGASPEMANEMADLTMGNELRDRQATAGAGLVDAMSGGAEIAAAAQWASRYSPLAEVIKEEFSQVRGVIDHGNQIAQYVDHEKK